jgi:hypothetical protein
VRLFAPEIKSITTMPSNNYLVEMKIAPTANILTPEEGIAFTDRFVLPTLQTCENLTASGEILAGGPILGAMGFAFIARADSPYQLENIVGSLAIWPRAQTTIVALGTFADRAVAVRERAASNKAVRAGSSVSTSQESI